ncbi:MAG: hypothetical protein AB1630_12840 [bacterium]
MKRIIFGIILFLSPCFGITCDEILKGVQGFIQAQDQAFSSYTANVRVEMSGGDEKEKGTIFATGSVSFERPDKLTTKIDEIKGDIKKEIKNNSLFEPLPPFDMYDIFKENHQFEYIGEEESLYLLKVFPKKEASEAVKGRVGINKEDFAISFDVETPNVNLGLFSCKMKMKARFVGIDKCWVPQEMFIENKMRMLLKRMDIKTQWFFDDYKF